MRYYVYKQTTQFTCGPACVLSVLKYLNVIKKPSRKLEMEIWAKSVLPPLKGTSSFGIAHVLASYGLEVKVVMALHASIAPSSLAIRGR